MKAADLRKSILQAAVQGKLVPQDKSDEPASELLKRIQAEKAILVKEGKLKKEKALPPITEDEIPYHLPEGWEWCKLGTICLKLTDGTHSTPTYVKTGVPFLSVKDVSTGVINFSMTKFISEAEHKELYKRCNPQRGDILLTKIGTTGIPVIVDTDVEFSLFVSIALMKLNDKYCYLDFIKYLLQSPLVQIQAQENTRGVGNKNWVLKAISNTIIALPPLVEQQRIVAKVDELMALCDELEAAEKELDALESHFFDYLPKSILQAAVQGKLVPQDKKDEPASELLKRIQAEKAVLIKEGKLKKEKPLSPITEDEIPYDLPDGWVWCHIGELVAMADNNNIQKNLPPSTIVSYVDIDAIDNKLYRIKATKKIPVNQLSTRARRVLSKGMIVYSLVRPYLDNIAVIESDEEQLIGSTGFAAFRTIVIPKEYLFSVLLCPYIRERFVSLLSGFNSPSISQTDFISTLFPLPPFAEQQRIVAKVNELMSMCDELKRVAEQPIDHSNVILFPTKTGPDDAEPIKMAAQGKVAVQPSKQHTAALDDLLEMMDDD